LNIYYYILFIFITIEDHERYCPENGWRIYMDKSQLFLHDNHFGSARPEASDYQGIEQATFGLVAAHGSIAPFPLQMTCFEPLLIQGTSFF